MMRKNLSRSNIIGLLICALFCSLPAAGAWADGAVYAMTNAVGNNQIFAYHRARDGTLTLMQTIATGGGGSGVQLSPPDSLGSQGGLVLDDRHHLLFAVNTETLAANSQDCQEGTITSFLVTPAGKLIFADRVMSGGLFPNSLAVKTSTIGDPLPGLGADLLYVLNAGGPGSSPFCGPSPNITGFTVDSFGHMSLLPDSVQAIIDPGPLDGTGTGVNCPVSGFATPTFDCGRNPPAFPRAPGQVGFTPDGTQLVVTVKSTNKIYVFPVGEQGAPMVTQAPGPALPTYFGFTFDQQAHLILTEPFGQATTIPSSGAGAVSSFTISEAGALQQISASVGDAGTAPCWIALEPITGRYAFVSNNLSNSLSSYSIGSDGSVRLLAAIAATPNGPNDLAAVAEGGASYLYVLDAGDGTLGAFRVNLGNGSLTLLSTVGGLPSAGGAAGLAAY
jgi:6-phosphogluconolactonase